MGEQRPPFWRQTELSSEKTDLKCLSTLIIWHWIHCVWNRFTSISGQVIDSVGTIDQDRVGPAEFNDAGREFGDLRLGMRARISGERDQRLDLPVLDVEHIQFWHSKRSGPTRGGVAPRTGPQAAHTMEMKSPPTIGSWAGLGMRGANCKPAQT